MTDSFYRVNKYLNKPYDYFKCITIVNPKQAAFYASEGVHLRDVRLGNDRETGEPMFLYYFYREETVSAYQKWCDRKGIKKDGN